MCEPTAFHLFQKLLTEDFYVQNECVKWISSEEAIVSVMAHLGS